MCDVIYLFVKAYIKDCFEGRVLDFYVVPHAGRLSPIPPNALVDLNSYESIVF